VLTDGIMAWVDGFIAGLSGSGYGVSRDGGPGIAGGDFDLLVHPDLPVSMDSSDAYMVVAILSFSIALCGTC